MYSSFVCNFIIATVNCMASYRINLYGILGGLYWKIIPMHWLLWALVFRIYVNVQIINNIDIYNCICVYEPLISTGIRNTCQGRNIILVILIFKFSLITGNFFLKLFFGEIFESGHYSPIHVYAAPTATGIQSCLRSLGARVIWILKRNVYEEW